MAVFTFLDLAERVLQEENKPLSVEEIWQAAQAKGYTSMVRATGKTPMATLGARMYVDMRDNKDSAFVKMGSRPRRFFLRDLVKDTELEKLIEKSELEPVSTKKLHYLERDLHPFLVYHAQYSLKAFCKTINHSKSAKKEFGEWVHPDIVGCYFPLDEWRPEVMEFGATIGKISVKLFSFEVKRELTFSNLRASFFQTVSNSSWANEGYLVAADISRDEEFLSELQRLSTSFGIGIIALDIEDPDSTEVLYPAKYREYLDWDAINKLAMNNDFREFLKRTRNDITGKEIRTELYDRVHDRDQLLKTLKK
ncbi:MAG: HTH domain-containing protein [Verrucomicrobia bacterium]|jgi:hypothetical protein|nr:HTH domain-containing protein [Verrucomicrobiota bacterium]